MNRIAGIFLGALLWARLAGAAEPPDEPKPEPTLALVGGRVLDGYEGRPIEDGVVLARTGFVSGAFREGGEERIWNRAMRIRRENGSASGRS